MTRRAAARGAAGRDHRQIETAQLLLTGEPGGQLDGGLVAPAFRGSGGKAHAPIVVEMPGATVLAADDGELIPVSTYACAFESSGAVVDFVAHSFDLGRADLLAHQRPLLRQVETEVVALGADPDDLVDLDERDPPRAADQDAVEPALAAHAREPCAGDSGRAPGEAPGGPV